MAEEDLIPGNNEMSFGSESEGSGSEGSRKINVDICATLLTTTAPKLPLREELPSLGFEVIYHASGVGYRASRMAARKAAKSFRKREEIRDMKKRRIFPKSKSYVKKKLEDRRQRELEIKSSTSAVTYDTYEKELHPKGSDDMVSLSTSSSTHSDEEGTPLTSFGSFGYKPAKLRSPVAKVKQRWSLLRGRVRGSGSSRGKEDTNLPKSIVIKSEPTKQERLQDMIGEPAFPDYLAPLGSTGLKDQLSCSGDASSISTPHGGLEGPSEEMQFVSSPQTKPMLPGIKSEDDDMFNHSVKNFQTAFDSAVEATVPDFLAAIDKAFDADMRETHSAAKEGGNLPNPPSVIGIPGGSPGVEDTVKDAFANIYGELEDEGNHLEHGSFFDTITQAFTSCDEYDTEIESTVNPETDEKQTVATVPLSPVSRSETEPADPGTKLLEENSIKEAKGSVWLNTAKLAFENIASDLIKVTGLVPSEDEAEAVAETEAETEKRERPGANLRKHGSIESLFAKLADNNGRLQGIEPILEANPAFVQVRRKRDSRFPLHVLCDRGLPDRSSMQSEMVTHSSLKDIEDFKDIIFCIHALHPDASLEQDKNGDLPVHLLARTLMQWEAQWYETVYREAARERDATGKTSNAITKLYHAMSECIEVLLVPLLQSVPLCHLPGSVGNILPLHIAAIFTSSVTTLRQLLEVYPGAASILCDQANLKTFVPNNATPLELHDLLSTDFPKWEMEAKQESNPEIKWSQSLYLRQGSDDCIRRSDLLFAYSQIAPYRFEKARIRRLESKVQFEAKEVVEASRKKMSHASELIWTWICTFREPKTGAPTYLNSVKRVTGALPLRSIRYLASVETQMGKQVIDAAIPECSAVIQRRLEELTETIIPVLDKPHQSTDKSSSTSSSLLRSWDDTQSARLSRTDRGLVNNICRLIFNVEETTFPTSFVILPYRLIRTEDGTLGIDSAESAAIAVRFADHLLQLTDPRSIFYYLDVKSERYYSESLFGDERNPSQLSAYKTVEEQASELMTLYEGSNGYLYLIDEVTGMPVVTDTEDVYPIVLNDSVGLVRKLLPLMLIGMLQMRGEKALSVLLTVLLDESVRALTPKWVDAAKEVGAYLYSQKAKEGSKSTDSKSTTGDIVHFISTSNSKMRSSARPSNGTTEWNVELSILKMLADLNDPDHTYHGLKRVEEGNDVVLWTLPNAGSPEFKEGSKLPIDSQESRRRDHIKWSDDASLDYSHDSDEVSLMKRRRQHGPVDLDQSISSDTESEPDLQNLAAKHAQLSKIHARLQDDTSYGWTVKSAYSDESGTTQSDYSNDGVLPSRNLPALNSTSVFQTKHDSDAYVAGEEKLGCLFKELAIENRSCTSLQNPAFDPCWDYGEQIRNELTSQLDNAPTVCSDLKVLQLKFKVAEEGRMLSALNHRLLELQEEKAVVFDFDTRALPDDFNEWHRNGLNTASKTRELIIRLQELQDRVLVDQVEMQHLALGMYVLTEGVNELSRSDFDVAVSRSEDASLRKESMPTAQDFCMGTSVDLQSEVPSEYRDKVSDNVQMKEVSESGSDVNDLIDTLRNPVSRGSTSEDISDGEEADYSPSEVVNGLELDDLSAVKDEVSSTESNVRGLTSSPVIDNDSSSEAEESSFLPTKKYFCIRPSTDQGEASLRLVRHDSSSIEPNRSLLTEEEREDASTSRSEQTEGQYGGEDSATSSNSMRDLTKPRMSLAYDFSTEEDEDADDELFKRNHHEPLTSIEFHQEFDSDEEDHDVLPLTTIAFQHSTDSIDADKQAEQDWVVYENGTSRVEI